jgi:hypothetical protein
MALQPPFTHTLLSRQPQVCPWMHGDWETLLRDPYAADPPAVLHQFC